MRNCNRNTLKLAKKTFNEKLHDVKDLPKVQFADKYGKMLIAAPVEYDELMKKIPQGKLTTSDELRASLARKHEADYTCQLTAGIFINIAANASQEREDAGSKDLTPFWRTLKKGGELNEKYPGGIDRQRFLLESEGHEIIKKGKRYYVKDFAEALYQFS